MNFPLLSIFCLLATSVALPASIVSLNNSLSPTDSANFHFSDSATTVRLKDSTGALLPVGSVLRVGFFVNYDNTLNASISSSSFGALTSNMNPNRFVPIGTGGGSVGDDVTANLAIRDLGGVSRVITSISNVDYVGGTPNSVASGLTRGTKLFVFLLNQNSFSGTPTEWGIFSADSWIVPSSGTATLALALKDVDTTSEVFRGRLGSLSTVPEPSLSLLTFCALGMGLRRRR